MAFRATTNWKTAVNRLRGSARYATSTSQKTKAYAPTADFVYALLEEERKNNISVRAQLAPVYVSLGLIVLSATMGLHAAKQQLMYAPNVRVRKKFRKTIPELFYPDKVLGDARKLIEKSFFRKVGHVQELKSGLHYKPNPIYKDVFAYPLRAETLKSVGIDPQPL